ncbi:MAG: homocitrate synthase [Oscillospiraceae bacterium]|nr:homocitrate synthase [Oscillospiraceae bacterium]
MKQKKYILDSTLRDGEQAPGVSFTRGQKLRIAAILDGTGVHQIEAGVPAASSFEKDTIIKIIENRRQTVISVWTRLVASDIRHAVDCKPDMIHVSVPVSYSHIYAKLKKNKSWVMNELCACIELVQNSGIPMSAGLEDSFRSEVSFMLSIAKTLVASGVTRIRLSDTVGIATPSGCREMIKTVSDALDGQAQLGFHAHNDLGLAVANTVEAMKSGCVYADTTVTGIGERAGNCDFAKLIRASGSLFDWGISAAAAQRAQEEFIDVIKK